MLRSCAKDFWCKSRRRCFRKKCEDLTRLCRKRIWGGMKGFRRNTAFRTLIVHMMSPARFQKWYSLFLAQREQIGPLQVSYCQGIRTLCGNKLRNTNKSCYIFCSLSVWSSGLQAVSRYVVWRLEIFCNIDTPQLVELGPTFLRKQGCTK